jgi:hypothetical protein
MVAWTEDMATQGCDRSADSGAGMQGGDGRPVESDILAESAKSQGFGGGVPIQIIVVATAETMRLVASHASDNILRNSHFSKENHPHD